MAYRNTGAGDNTTGAGVISGGNSGGNSSASREDSLELPHVSVLLTFPLSVSCSLRPPLNSNGQPSMVVADRGESAMRLRAR